MLFAAAAAQGLSFSQPLILSASGSKASKASEALDLRDMLQYEPVPESFVAPM